MGWLQWVNWTKIGQDFLSGLMSCAFTIMGFMACEWFRQQLRNQELERLKTLASTFVLSAFQTMNKHERKTMAKDIIMNSLQARFPHIESFLIDKVVEAEVLNAKATLATSAASIEKPPAMAQP